MEKISLIVPVFNRPDEVRELLESLTEQTVGSFELIIVEDGSQTKCVDVVAEYAGKLNISYHLIENGGPGPARNFGAKLASGDFLIVLDSDCILPPGYIQAVRQGVEATQADVFGGPDRAAEHFAPLQKAINYSMTSFWTTGGIRGGQKKLDRFYPRSFNMGMWKHIYESIGGFARMRFGEDIDLSIRLHQAGYRVKLLPEAWVYHKRRTDWRKFYRQVYNSGIARINLYKKYPHSLKAVHLLPALFTMGIVLCLATSAFSLWSLLPPLAYALLVMLDAGLKNRSLKIGLLSVLASYIQLTGYGCGFISAVWNRLIRRKGEFSAFDKTFYK
ncbi:MAG: glycosyltransferase [Tannerellaceae bacterium]|jgi:glycosyltransferase involved in cell wall biosynthesis|nr:glycosyltransferase [Tannerellaceae bacterium]